ncbi:MAG: hypothetical protein M3160_00135 [Candidatus Eremiobacteraeota bacterium]|nr:hypothetical protein [Candidatus Eremiobacteraeota bacterium]
MKAVNALLILSTVGLITACSSNGNSINPTVSPVSLGNSKLQFAVGTANVAFDGAIALNTVATFRQPNGTSATLVNTPMVTGPAGFIVPATAPAADAGTNHISASPQNPNVTQTPTPTTFSSTGGVFSYGFGPFNNSASEALYPGNPPLYAQPFYSPSGGLTYVGAPPAYPFFNDGTYPAGFQGYSQGFNAFEATPVAGSYTLSVNVPIANAPSQTFTASATLTNTVVLSTLPTPAFTSDGAGGGAATVTVPADPRIVETLIYVADTTKGTYYTLGPARATGIASFTLPDNLGPCNRSGCQGGANATPSISSGDAYQVYAASYDYPAFEASPPISTNQTPTITGTNGQADVSLSKAFSATY